MDDLKKSIINTINERMTSPLFGSFIISWALWNYKTIFIILSTKTVEDKFSYIENILYSHWWSFPLIGLILPLITSLLFIFIFPYPEKSIYVYWYSHKEKLKREKQKIDNEKLLTKEESRKLTKKIIQLESEHFEEIDAKNQEIATLKEIITNNDKQESKSTTEKKELPTFDEITNGKKQYFEIDENNKTFKVVDVPENKDKKLTDSFKEDELFSFQDVFEFIKIMTKYMQDNNLTSLDKMEKDDGFKSYLKNSPKMNKYFLHFEDYYNLARHKLYTESDKINQMIKDT